jgi:hypothetical protein
MLNKKSPLYLTLARALSIKRPHMAGDSQATKFFTSWLQDALPAHLRDDPELVWLDAVGNLHVDNRIDATNRTLFVAHVDTVHREMGPNKIRKTKSKWYADGAPLGADDGAGCAMLMHLIHNHTPAYYIFTQGEECGGIGAGYLAEHYPALLNQFSRAIAFDRRGIDGVISHQGYGRCCSDGFAQALSDALNAGDDNLMYLPDDTGIYTDTAEFIDIIPECTNISVGYDHEHSVNEELDIYHLTNLAKAVLKVQWDLLPTQRDPLIPEPRPRYENWLLSAPAGGYDSVDPRSVDLPYADYVEDDELSEMYDCLDLARGGRFSPLIQFVAAMVYPEDPELAERFIDRKKITEEVLDTAEQMLAYMGPAAVCCEMFDEIYGGSQ